MASSLTYNSTGASGAPVDVMLSNDDGGNEFLKCADDGMPSVHDYLQAVDLVGISLFAVGAVAVFFILYLYIDTLRHVLNRSPSSVKTHTAIIVSVYPVVGVACYCAMIVPRAQLLAEATTQGIFMAAMYQLFCLFIAYSGGEAEVVQKVKPDVLDMRVGPCCCYPCCCFPELEINKRNLRSLRCLVLQLPIVQGIIYAILLVMWAEEESLYQVNYMYLQPVSVTSILTGIWGVSMTMKMLSGVLKDHCVHPKFFVLQFVLLLAKFQGLTVRVVVWWQWMPCEAGPLTTSVYSYLVFNTAMLGEMLVLSFIARRLYKMDLPDENPKPHHPQIHVISEKFAICNTDKDVVGGVVNNNNNIDF